MAKKAMINKQQATPKYSTRAYNRCIKISFFR